MDFRMQVRVNPGTSQRRVVWKGEFLKVNLTSPPEQGEANEELIEVLSKEFDCDRQQIVLEQGHNAPEKEVRLRHFDREHLIQTIKALKG